MNIMNFELTDEQIIHLAPLLDEAKIAAEKGMVLLRLDDERPSEAIFLPHKYATQIKNIMVAFKEEEEDNGRENHNKRG